MQLNNYTDYVVVNKSTAALTINSVLRKTYLLLSATLIFTAITAFLAMAGNVRYPGPMLTIFGMFGLLFLTQSLRNSKWGLFAIFAFTGFMGYTLAPLLNFYLHSFANGGAIVIAAAGGTGVIFLALSAFTLISRKDFSYLGGFLFVAVTVAFLAGLASLFLNYPLLPIIVSAAFVLLSSGLILFHTSQIIQGGETNYIMATISLYVAVFNLFVSLLNIIGVFGGRRN
ncbi:MAG: Bax inhibitor-1/YccA family protein [Gammaproteobacteria bacterium]|nr:Bax inhibitor-1/YccA family protein [Gammaproteobacteria bacterium]